MFSSDERNRFEQVANSSQVDHYENLSNLGIGNYDLHYGNHVKKLDVNQLMEPMAEENFQQ